MKKLAFLFIGLSLLLNLFFISIDIIPIIRNKVAYPTFISNPIVYEDYKSLVWKRSLCYLEYDKPLMAMKERSSFDNELRSLGNKEHEADEDPLFYYHRAFLYLGIAKYLNNFPETETKTRKIVNRFYAAISVNDTLKSIHYVDQIPFALASIYFYKLTSIACFKEFADNAYLYLLLKDSESGILYRDGGTIQLSDVLGMVVPFLYEYASSFNVPKASEVANKQLTLYYKYGVDKETGIPSHGYNLKTKVKIGSSNWGRGIGWYTLALCCSDILPSDSLTYQFLLDSKSEDNIYNQFIGNISEFDMSASLLIQYSLLKRKKLSCNDVQKCILNFYMYRTSLKGDVFYTSGDTKAPNQYSRNFGYSELSQGLMLMIFSELFQNEKENSHIDFASSL